MKCVRTIACVTAAAATLMAAGCGDDEEEPQTTGEPLTKEEFIAQADQICADGNAEIEEASSAEFSSGSVAQEEVDAFVVEVTLPNIQEQSDQIAALTPPEGDEDQVDAILEALNSAIDEAEADPALASAIDSPFQEANRLVLDYGLNECGDE